MNFIEDIFCYAEQRPDQPAWSVWSLNLVSG